ncbi:diiron oxygenase [Actinomadura macrotermitis]|uniref:Diiron oxygenase n=1 Tax=Actinomadura macrotermitis TaxID=2585200 RepID=A0A7K0BV73_9ACTN|nr:diiron oxygenase [Actinomadura macrotermitis]MQY05057.1 hypothetical protein [Actinomadura macrotermitis]
MAPQGPSGAMERDLLGRLSDRWGKQVAVKKDELDLDGHFDPALPDFPARLVPLFGIPRVAAADQETRHRVLAGAWISYNARTSAVEQEVILPACRLMLTDRLPGRRDSRAKEVLHQTIIDEHYHILMCMNAAGVTARRRELTGLDFDDRRWRVVEILNARRDAALTERAKDLVTLAFSVAAETVIGAYLLTVSSDMGIQPMNRLSVHLHRQDETGHAVVFRELVASVYRALGTEEQAFFRQALRDGLAAFPSPDHRPWVAIAGAAGLDVSEDDVAAAFGSLPPLPRDTGPLRRLLAELDITESFGL